MKNTKINSRKTDYGSVTLYRRENGLNPCSFYLVIYDRITKKQKLEFINVNGIENEKQAFNAYSQFEGYTKNKEVKNFTDFFKIQYEKIEKKQSREVYQNLLKMLQLFAGEKISFKIVNNEFLQMFRLWLMNEAISERTKQPFGDKTQHTCLQVVKTMANKAKDKGYIPAYQLDISDVKNIDAEANEVIFFDDTELRTLRATPYPALPYLPKFFFLQLNTLQRFGEMPNLTWEAINSVVKQQKTGKEIPMFLDENLLKWIAGDKIRAGKVFPNVLVYTCMLTHLKAWVKLAGIDKKVGTHTFRRTGASIMHKRGASIYFIGKLLGHSSEHTTRLYIGLDKEDYPGSKRPANC